MSLKALAGRARDWLLGGRDNEEAPKPVLAVDSIRATSYDERFFQGLHDEVPGIAKMVKDLNVRYGYTYDMVRDLALGFFQSAPALRGLNEMKPSHVRNHAVSTDVQRAPETARTRNFTVHDRYGTAMATLGVLERVQKFLEEQDELEEEQKKEEQAEQDRQEAEEALEQAAQEAEDADADHPLPEDGEGPQTPAQAAAEAALMAALEAATQAADAQQAAAGEVQKAALSLQHEMAPQVDKAVKDAGDELEAEEALFKAWGKTDGEIKKMSYQERLLLARRLRSNRLSKFAQKMGRRRIAAEALRAKRTEFGRDEVVGTEMSGDIGRVLAGEWVKSRHPKMRLDFLRRLSEGQLLSKKFVGIEKVRGGAIIGLCDNSGSMDKVVDGMSREAWAKAAMLCMLDQARADGRDFVWINFSSAHQQQMWYFPKGQADLMQVLEAAEQFFDGGTDIEVPMDMAMQILEENPDLKGDITLLTDEEVSVSLEWHKKYLDRKERLGFRTFGIAIGFKNIAGGLLEALSDEARAIMDFKDPADLAPLWNTL